jgi:hypothetical protein
MTAVGRSTTRIGSARAWALRGTVIVGAGLALFAAWPVASAGADPCPLTDPLCVIETPEDTVDQTVDAVKEDQAGTAVDTIQKTVKDLTDPADDPGGGGGGGGGGNDDQQGGGKGNGSDRLGPDGRSTPPNVGVVPTTGTGGITLVPTTVGENVTVAQIDEETPILSRDLPAALREAVVGLALPLLLVMGIVVGFTMFQKHLDRRDPKLALAPLSADVLRFT